METLDIMTVATVTTATVEAFKRTSKLSFLNGWYPLFAIIIATIIAVLGGLGFMSGLIAGLVSQGLYDTVGKPTVTRISGLVKNRLD